MIYSLLYTFLINIHTFIMVNPGDSVNPQFTKNRDRCRIAFMFSAG